jgi:hypothetical protein
MVNIEELLFSKKILANAHSVTTNESGPLNSKFVVAHRDGSIFEYEARQSGLAIKVAVLVNGVIMYSSALKEGKESEQIRLFWGLLADTEYNIRVKELKESKVKALQLLESLV